MALLEIRRSDGSTETRPLSRTQPVSIGRMGFNDLVVADDGVPAMHSRIAWKGDGFEIVAATKTGVEVNGGIAPSAFLKSGDVMRIGSLELVFFSSSSAQTSAAQPSPRSTMPSDESSLVSVELGIDSLSDVVDDADDDSLEEFGSAKELERRERERQAERAKRRADDFAARLGAAPAGAARREVAKSPLILSLGAGAVVLLLVTGTLWFVLSREAIEQHFQRATNQRAAGQFAQAVASFDEFLQKYPRDRLADGARLQRSLSEIQGHLSGASPNLAVALGQLQEFVKIRQTGDQFVEVRPDVLQFCEQLATSAAARAETTADNSFLELSDSAKLLLERSADPKDPPTSAAKRIDGAVAKAKIAILKQRSLESTLADMTEHLDSRRPMDAMNARQSLVARYPDLAAKPALAQRLEQARLLEAELGRAMDVDVAATVDEAATSEAKAIWPASLSRIRVEESIPGRVGFVLAKDVVVAADATTGEPLWRRAVGFGSSFLPMPLPGPQSLALLHDARRHRLLACDRETGAVRWSQPCPSSPVGRPVVSGGQLYMATEEGLIQRIAIDSGRVTSELQLSQRVSNSLTALVDGDRLVVAGEAGVVYTVGLHPLTITAVTYLGHAPNAVRAPLIQLGGNLLICENTGADSVRLRVLSVELNGPLNPVAELSLSGNVLDAPVLRGSQLVVPLTQERLAAFQVTDEAGRPPLVGAGLYQLPARAEAPMYLGFGPEDRFWAASTAFRRFDVLGDQIRLDPNSLASGLATQPLQPFGDDYLLARKLPYSDAVVFSRADREKMSAPWRLVAGADVRIAAAASSGSVIAVNEHGLVVTYSSGRWTRPGAETNATELELPKDVATPLKTGPGLDGRLIVAADGAESRCWIVAAGGAVETQVKGPGSPALTPLSLRGGLVWPLVDRLALLNPTTGASVCDDWLLPREDAGVPRWIFAIRWGDHDVLVADSRSRMIRLTTSSSKKAQWTEVAGLDLPSPPLPFVASAGDKFALAHQDGRIRCYDRETLDQSGELNLEGAPLALWSMNDAVLVASSNAKNETTLQAIDPPSTPPSVRWTVALDSDLPASQIAVDATTCWIACRSGRIVQLDSTAGKVLSQRWCPQAVNYGTIRAGAEVIVLAVDGSAYRVSDLPENEP